MDSSELNVRLKFSDCLVMLDAPFFPQLNKNFDASYAAMFGQILKWRKEN